MHSFSALTLRTKLIEEARNPYEHAHPKFGEITSVMRQKGFPSAPYDTIIFIANCLVRLELISDEEADSIYTGKGFSAKKQALLNVLGAHATEIKDRSEEISQIIQERLPIYIEQAIANRGRSHDTVSKHGYIISTPEGRAEKYEANALALQMAKQAKELSKSVNSITQQELTDMFAGDMGKASEMMLVAGVVDKVISDIRDNLDEEGVEIDEYVLDQVEDYAADNIHTIKDLRAFIRKIGAEPGYEKIAFYLLNAIEPAKKGLQRLQTLEPGDIDQTSPQSRTQSSSPVYQGDISFGDDSEVDDIEPEEFDDSDLEDTTDKDWEEIEHPLDKGDYNAPTEGEPDDDLGLDIDFSADDPSDVEEPVVAPQPKPPAPKPLPRKSTIFTGDINFGEEEEGAQQDDTIQFSGDESIGEFHELLQNHPNATISIDTDVDSVSVDVVGGRIVGVYSTNNPDNSYNADLISSHIKRWFNSPSITIGRVITAAGEKASPYTEAYTASYLPVSNVKQQVKQQSILTRERFKPKSMWQM